MKVALSLLFSAAFIQTAAGIICNSNCSACWKTGSPGVDVKIGCWANNCPASCPDGYENIHCAEWQRCMWVDPLICLWWHLFSSSSSGLTKLSQIGADHLGVQYLAHVFVDSTQIHMGGKSAMQACVLVRICAAELLSFVINSKLVYIVIFFLFLPYWLVSSLENADKMWFLTGADGAEIRIPGITGESGGEFPVPQNDASTPHWN